MMIIDPVALGDVACTRASTGTYFDRNGVLQTAPANTLRVTYDPSDLDKAPYALVEQAATNLTPNSDAMIGGNWSLNGTFGFSTGVADPRAGTSATTYLFGSGFSGTYMRYDGSAAPALVDGQAYTFGFFYKPRDGGVVSLLVGIESPVQRIAVVDGAVTSRSDGVTGDVIVLENGWFLMWMTFTANASGNRTMTIYSNTDTAFSIDVFGAQMVAGTVLGSYVPSGTRAADVISSGAGLVYSNVPISETAYSATATYAKDAVVYDPVSYLTYQSLIASNTGKALTDTASWTPLLNVVNQRLMFDEYNYTQTSSAEEIIVVLSPQAMAQGVFLGNLVGSEFRISCVDLTEGLVYQEVQSLAVLDTGSSFYNWCFKRIKKKSYAVTVQLPPYATALVTIAIKRPGDVAKCGVCAVGPLVDIGLAQYGISREIKDYSTVNFNTDGTSNVVKRNFAKVMEVDLIVDNDQIDSVIEALEGYRQKQVVWVGTTMYGSTCIYGTYTSFKNVISYPTESAMNLQLQGTV